MATAVSSDRRTQIAESALALVDREGLDALSMRRLATELGLGTMTLYGYFATKDDLLDAVVARAATGRGAIPVPDGPWDERLRAIARAWHRNLNRHPSLVQLRLRRPIVGREVFRVTEVGLAALRDAGFSPAAAARAFRVLFLYVFGTATFNDAEVTAGRRREIAMAVLALPEDEFPVLSGLAGEMGDAMGGEEQFEFGLDVLIAGLAARARALERRA
jgi:AcrR family transcriptional regulator